MGKRISISITQLVVLVLLSVLIAVCLTILVFLAGQRSALGLLGPTGTPTVTSSPTMPPLPKAMTATSPGFVTETLVLTEEEINSIVASYSNAGYPVTLQDVQITTQQVQVNGALNYENYQGDLEVSGVPYVQNRQLRIQLDDIALDGQSLPQFLYPTVEDQIDIFFEELTSGYFIQSVELQDGRMVMMVVPW